MVGEGDERLRVGEGVGDGVGSIKLHGTLLSTPEMVTRHIGIGASVGGALVTLEGKDVGNERLGVGDGVGMPGRYVGLVVGASDGAADEHTLVKVGSLSRQTKGGFAKQEGAQESLALPVISSIIEGCSLQSGSGIGPDRLFLDKLRYFKAVADPSSAGIGPMSAVPLKSRCVREYMDPILVGRLPPSCRPGRHP